MSETGRDAGTEESHDQALKVVTIFIPVEGKESNKLHFFCFSISQYLLEFQV